MPGGPVWEGLLTRLDDVADMAGAADVPTYPARAPLRRIDGIFVDRVVKVTGYQVLDSPETRRASDHLPVYAELDLPG